MDIPEVIPSPLKAKMMNFFKPTSSSENIVVTNNSTNTTVGNDNVKPITIKPISRISSFENFRNLLVEGTIASTNKNNC